MTTIYTIGHGSRTMHELVELLAGAGIERLADVRAYPASRRHPQFAREALERSLAEAGIRYRWEGKALGGKRKSSAVSPHVALEEPAFRAYADHMDTPEFHAGMARIVGLAGNERVALMCAERKPSECHRNFIADWLVASGVTVVHIVAPGDSQPHALNALARRDGERLVYDAGAQFGLDL